MLPIRIQWCCLVPEYEQFTANSLDELTKRLFESYPQLPRIETRKLTCIECQRLPKYIEYCLPDQGLSQQNATFSMEPTFVFCNASEPFAIRARRCNPKAKWGAAMQGCFALCWQPNKFLLWHEAMHLLYADDCYDRDAYPCDVSEGKCLMQYEPCFKNCGGDLHLCSYNLCRIINNC